MNRGEPVGSAEPASAAEGRNGSVVTFYSFKGGVGRSMALANVAVLLARDHHKEVVLVDWDLEAPGLHRFFDRPSHEITNGLIDYLVDYREQIRSGETGVSEADLDLDGRLITLREFEKGGRIRLLAAGDQRDQAAYATKVNEFDWPAFYRDWKGGQLIEYVRHQLKQKADVVLIDSRTGITEMGGVCTIQMPDVVVLVFAFNNQNIEGIAGIAKEVAGENRFVELLNRHPKILLLPSRKELAEVKDLAIWERKAVEMLGKYASKELLPQPHRDSVDRYMRESAIPYVPTFNYGERIADESTPGGFEVVRAYRVLAELIAQGPPVASAAPRAKARSWFETWMEAARAHAGALFDRGGVLSGFVRLLIVVSAAAVGFMWQDAEIGKELAWQLQAAGLTAVSLGASAWQPIFAIEWTLSCLWFLQSRPRTEAPARFAFTQLTTFLNRQAGHIEALFVWLVLILATTSRLGLQLPLAAGLFMLGEPIIDYLGRRFGHSATANVSVDRYWMRRPFIYAATVAGLAGLVLVSPSQSPAVLPLVAAILLGGVVPRFVRHAVRRRSVLSDRLLLREQSMRHRAEFRAVQAGLASKGDMLGPLLLVSFLVLWVFVAGTVEQQRQVDRPGAGQVASEKGAPCPDEPAPAAPDLQLFVSADTHAYALTGALEGPAPRRGAVLVGPARPVELELLSISTLAHFAAAYGDLAAAGRNRIFWAHLGDLVEVSCKDELERVLPILGQFARSGALAGVAVGEHDGKFLGEFRWSPWWDRVCPGGRVGKVEADSTIRALTRSLLVSGARAEIVPGQGLEYPRQSALVTVSPLGLVRHRGQTHGLIAVFIDTADGHGFDFAEAGFLGKFSEEQAMLVRALVADQRRQGGAWADPLYLVLGHHSITSMTGPSEERLHALLAELNVSHPSGHPSGEVAGPRLLALVAAHQHRGAARIQCIARHEVPEIVIGSTIDPPQEATRISIGPGPNGLATIHARTLPAVQREGQCGASGPAVRADVCENIVRQLREDSDCRVLFRARSEEDPSCESIERRASDPNERRSVLLDSSPEWERRKRITRARDLVRCICRGDLCRHDVDVGPNTALDRLWREAPEPRRAELTCLAWAASYLHAYQGAGITMGDALRCAFEERSVPGPRTFKSSLELRRCD